MARFRKHEVKQFETIQTIAQTETNDLNNWLQIADYNELEYPYIVDNPDQKLDNPEHLVIPGDFLVIPMKEGIEPDDLYKMTKQDQEFIQSLTLGRDLDMTHLKENYHDKGTQDHIFELTHNGVGDVKTVQGADNVKQAALARLMTPKGALLGHPEYGSNLHNLFGKATNEQMKLIEQEITRTIQMDTRVNDCSLVNHYIDKSVYYGNYTARIDSIEDQFDFLISSDASGSIIVR